jgi:uncharacterized protein
MQNAINWFEIPSVDFDRAVQFYSDILAQPVRRDEFMGVPHGMFASDEHGVGGAIVKSSDHQSSKNGVVIYLNAGRDIDGILSRVEPAGGQVVTPKISIGEQGYMALMLDTEGNKIGLHQPSG